MNTKQFSDKLVALKKADNAAFVANTKSNFVIDFIRNELIKKAFTVDPTVAAAVSVEFNMTAASILAPALALLSKDGQYPRLLAKAVMEFENGNIKFTYKINKAALTEDYVEKLNTRLGITLTV